jgi:hypothetical protein
MNEKKMKQLFASARRTAAPEPPPDFAADVLRAVRLEPAAKFDGPASLFDHLNMLFPRAALAATAVIIVCAVTDLAANLPGVEDGAAQVSAQFLFNAGDL